jgi:ribosomal protein L16 Arg81 hydroxylase
MTRFRVPSIGLHPEGGAVVSDNGRKFSLGARNHWTAGRIVWSMLLETAGASLIAPKLDPHVPSLGALCDDVRARIAEGIQAGAIVTTGTGGALPLHFDSEDLIVLQVEGSKRWKIYSPPVANPVKDMPKPPAPDGLPAFDEVLGPGDFLFLPAGHWHYCENVPGRSLHVGIFFEPPTGWHAVKALMPQLLAEETFRIPFTRLGGESEKRAMSAD